MKKLKLGSYFLFFSAIFSIAVFLQNSKTDFACRTPSSTTANPVCIPTLGQVVDAHSRQATLGVLRQELTEVETDFWSAETLFPVYRAAVQENRNWTDFRLSGIKRNAKVFWIQQRELKALNEQYWNLAGTEYYLAILDLELTRMLDENPALGVIIHRNYKDRVVVSSLSETDFNTQVMQPLKASLTKKFMEARFGKDPTAATQFDYWRDWIDTRLVTTSSNSFVEAHLKHKNIDLQSYGAWKLQTEELLQGLKTHIKNSEEFFAALDLTRKARGDQDKTKEMASSLGLEKATLGKLQTLNETLQVADFLPVNATLSAYDASYLQQFFKTVQRDKQQLNLAIAQQGNKFEESWLLQRQVFLRNTFKTGHSILALDRKNFGSLALRARLQWFEQGADQNQLPQIYENLSRELVEDYDQLLKKIRDIIGLKAEVFLYRSGDDALVSLPQITVQQKSQIDALLIEVAPTYHSFLSEIKYKSDRATNVANAIFDAREKLFNIQ